MRDYPKRIAPTSSQQLDVNCTLIRLKESNVADPVLIEGYSDNGQAVMALALYPGSSVRSPVRLKKIRIENQTAVEMQIVLLCGDGDFQDDRVPNTVVYESQAENLAKIGRAYLQTITVNQNSGYYGLAGIYNNPLEGAFVYPDQGWDSTDIILINRLQTVGLTDAFVRLAFDTPSFVESYIKGKRGVSKQPGSADSIHPLYKIDANAIQAVPDAERCFRTTTTDSGIIFDPPIALYPGMSAMIWSNVPSINWDLSIEWYQQQIGALTT